MAYSTMVLLVDDQPLVGETVRRRLAQQPDIGLHFCPYPLRAVELANQIKPTVILQDLVMPEVDGLEMVRRYRSNGPTSDTPIIVLSSEEDPQVKSDAFAAGANDYLVKLPDQIELVARIRYHSRCYINQLQRDAAHCALRESQQQLLESNTALLTLNHELAEANRTISEMARRDPLTGLSNRRVLDEELYREASRANRTSRPMTAIVMDLDHFKQINDNYGHAIGDGALRAIASLLGGHVRPTDLVTRYGGEEFVLLLADTDLSHGMEVAERIRVSLTELSVPDCPVRLTASFGVATLQPGQSASGLLRRADAALYRAKQNGRDRAEAEEPSLNVGRDGEEVAAPNQHLP